MAIFSVAKRYHVRAEPEGDICEPLRATASRVRLQTSAIARPSGHLAQAQRSATISERVALTPLQIRWFWLRWLL